MYANDLNILPFQLVLITAAKGPAMLLVVALYRHNKTVPIVYSELPINSETFCNQAV